MEFIPSTIDTYVTANSYLSLDDITNMFFGNHSLQWEKLDEEAKKECLTKISFVLDGYFYPFKDEKTNKNQILEFPRRFVERDEKGNVVEEIEPTEDEKKIPDRVKMACKSFLKLWVKSELFNGIKRKKIGEIEIEFFKGNNGTVDAENMLKPFLNKSFFYMQRYGNPFII